MNESVLAPVEASQPSFTSESLQETLEEHEQNEKPLQAEVPGKGKKGRPRKHFPEKAQDDGSPVIKRPRGRPKGSKNKNPKPPPDTSLPKRGRGRPRKNATLTPQLPTMVGVAEVAPLSAEGTATDTVPIATDIVPPDDLFNNDDVD
ncbi:uncharacterized protein [Porites lutea]|uniref:uncharacterized protein isoform X2 n=1 Tax=Porites lutea TaxID=51062 RepID=UPI003CC572D8